VTTNDYLGLYLIEEKTETEQEPRQYPEPPAGEYERRNDHRRLSS